MGISFRNLTVRGSGSGWILIQTFPQALLSLLGYDIFRFLKARLLPASSGTTKEIISNFSGVIKAGEMLLPRASRQRKFHLPPRVDESKT